MQVIAKRSKAPNEIIPVTESESSIKDEINRRTCKAGYTDSDGQMMTSRNSGAGKGDVPRPCNGNLYRENYVKAFGHD